MRRSGFVLAGGTSSRMGRDKALLPYRGTTLVEYVARAVGEAVGWVAVVGDPDRYRELRHAVYRDKLPGCGPLGGIYTALSVTESDWNLIVACDMPGITACALRSLVDREAAPGCTCIMAAGPGDEVQPLCAVYHRCCLPVVARAIRNKRFKMRDLVPDLEVELRPLDEAALANVNTPGEWAQFEEHDR